MSLPENSGIFWQSELDRVFVSSGFHCPLGCLYCYIYPEGFQEKQPEVNDISGQELVRILASDRRFKRGPDGTIVSLGCVSDPFHPKLLDKTMEFLSQLSKIRNPIQFSTKFAISCGVIEEMCSLDSVIYPFISVCSLKNWRKLEPLAPSPSSRLKTLHDLVNSDMIATLLYKPLILGVNDDERVDLIDSAVYSGARHLVVGSLYISETILNRISNAGFDTTVLSKIPIDRGRIADWLDSKPHYSSSHAIQEEIIKQARSRGLKAFKSTICVVILNSKLYCRYKSVHPRFCVHTFRGPVSRESPRALCPE